MLNDYEKLRQEQLKFLDNWYDDFVIPARREKGHHNFSLDYGKIYAIRLDDLVYFANKNKMTFEFEHYMSDIIFRDIRR